MQNMRFPKTDFKNQLTSFYIDLVYVLVFLGDTWKDGRFGELC